MKKILLMKHYWMAVGPGDVGDYYLIRSTRRDVVRAIQGEMVGDIPQSLAELKRAGWRAVKVRIVPIEGSES